MDETNLILTQPVLPPVPLNGTSQLPLCRKSATANNAEINGVSEKEGKQIAKDFESVLLHKLVDEMKNTIGGWGFEEDGPCEQVQGIFWLYLAREAANNGGIGLWKDIYKFLTGTQQTSGATNSVDGNI
jgi:Rod binding domain-containing protein